MALQTTGDCSALPSLPQRLHEYNGPITRGARWDTYRPRAGDIIVSAPAKSGMTWTQAILAMLVFGRADIDVQPAKLSPWFDAKFEPLAQMLQRLEAQTHRRYLKTHTPLDGLPYYPECTYLAVYRHPLDAFYSAASLSMATARGTVRMRSGMPSDIHSYMQACIRTPFTEGMGDQLSVGFVAHHVLGYWAHRALPNVHIFHYADMSRDLPGSIEAIGAVLGIAVRDVAAIAEATSFSNMQKRAAQFVPENDGSWKSANDFFRGGSGRKWEGILSADDLAEYRAVLSAALPDENLAAWLEHGSVGGPV